MFYHSPARRRRREEAAISSLIIDGYNLIGTAHGDLAAERDRLVQRLIGYRSQTGHDITVVFDGWKSGGRSEERSIKAGVTIIYTRLGDTADRVISRMIGADRREWLVISSDREVVRAAWASGCVPVPAGAFMEALGRDKSDERGEHDTIDGDEGHTPGGGRTGRAQTLSKKERALQRALRKL